MSRLQFARKPAQSAERNLRLVPPPKRRRRPRWKIGRIRRPKYGNNHALHAYEDEMVLAAMRTRNGVVSVNGLCDMEPGRWDPAYLLKTLQRLRAAGRVAGTGNGRGRARMRLTYVLKDEED